MSAQANKSLFLFGFDVTNTMNRYIEFQNVLAGPTLTATLTPGNYTATEFLAEAKSAMEIADPSNTYTWSIDRTTSAGDENRVSVSTSGSFLSILFGSGSLAANSPASLLGYAASDLTGATSYTGFTHSGTILIPDFPTWNYHGPDQFVTNDGVKNVSASGVKETLVFAQMRFFDGEWRYITNFNGNTQLTEWEVFLKYATKQLAFEFEPSIKEDPTEYYGATLESTPEDGNGMAYKLKQMTDIGMFRFYKTGILKFRVKVTA